MKKLSIVLLMTLLLLWGCAKETKDPIGNSAENIEEEGNTIELEKSENDINLDDSNTNIDDQYLLEEESTTEEQDETYINNEKNASDVQNEQVLKAVEDLKLVGKLNDFKVIEGIRLYLGKEMDKYIDISNNSAMGGNLELRDIDSDGIKDIIIYEFIGGSGNIQNIYIYKRAGEEISRLIGPDNYVPQENFYSEYLGEGNIYFEDRNTGFKKEYNILVPYENEDWSLEEVKGIFGMGDKAWVDPYSSFQIVDEDNDGLFEIRANQIICGIAHVDLIGEMTTIYALEQGAYIPREVIYYMIDHEDWKKEEIGRSKFPN